MRELVPFFLAVGVLGALATASVSVAKDKDKDDKPKYTIEHVMEKAHKGGAKSLIRKVLSGKASQEEKDKLVEYYTSLPKNKPPKGDLKSWKEKSTALLNAAKEVAAGKDGATAELKKAVNCAACHKVHRKK